MKSGHGAERGFLRCSARRRVLTAASTFAWSDSESSPRVEPYPATPAIAASTASEIVAGSTPPDLLPRRCRPIALTIQTICVEPNQCDQTKEYKHHEEESKHIREKEN